MNREQICRAIQTGFDWGGDGRPAIYLYSFASCRGIHEESYRELIINAAVADIHYLATLEGMQDDMDPAKEIAALEHLIEVVKVVPVGELISYNDYWLWSEDQEVLAKSK